jgi:hypothetical protein
VPVDFWNAVESFRDGVGHVELRRSSMSIYKAKLKCGTINKSKNENENEKVSISGMWENEFLILFILFIYIYYYYYFWYQARFLEEGAQREINVDSESRKAVLHKLKLQLFDNEVFGPLQVCIFAHLTHLSPLARLLLISLQNSLTLFSLTHTSHTHSSIHSFPPPPSL